MINPGCVLLKTIVTTVPCSLTTEEIAMTHQRDSTKGVSQWPT